MKQTRTDSFMESMTNVAIGFGINFAANVLILPAVLGVPVHLAALGLIGLLYTIISVVRSYALRRAFNGRSAWQAIKGRLRGTVPDESPPIAIGSHGGKVVIAVRGTTVALDCEDGERAGLRLFRLARKIGRAG